jgi:acyl carrier protein
MNNVTGERGCLAVTEVQDLLVTKFAEAAGIDPSQIDIHELILSYGLGSIQLVSFVGELEDKLSLQLPPTLAWDYPTIAGLTEFVWAEIERSRQAGASIQRI